MKTRLFMILAVLVLVTAVGCTKGSDGSSGVPGGSDGAGVTGVTGVPGGSDGSGVPGVNDVTGGNSGETSNRTSTGNGDGNNTSRTDGNGQDVAGTKCIITAFAVGKADAILISSGDANILVDAGEEDDAEYILAKLKEKGISRLDLLLVTHFDKDHAGGVPQILENIAVDRIYYPDYANTGDTFMNFKRALSGREEDLKVTRITEFTAGDLTMKIYPEEDPNVLRAKSDDFDNNMSLVSMLYYRDHRFLFCGDIEQDRIGEILKAQDESGDTGIALKCDWIKMPHHGRYNKKTADLLDACEPSYAVMTDSDEEVAATDTQVELIRRKITSFTTRKGDVVTIVDGNGISVDYAG